MNRSRSPRTLSLITRHAPWLSLVALTVFSLGSIRPAAAITQCYWIEGVTHNLVLDIAGGSTAAGASVIVWPKKDPPAKNQLWSRGGEKQPIISALNEYVLTPGLSAGAPAVVRPLETQWQLWSNARAWQIGPRGAPQGVLILSGPGAVPNLAGDYRLDARSGSPAAGTQVVTTPPDSDLNKMYYGQAWRFVAAPSCGS